MFKAFFISLTRFVVVMLILLSTSILLSIIYFFNSDINTNVLSFNHSTNSIQNNNGVITGKFTAQENYLGIITVWFDNKLIPSDYSVFKIKNVLEKDWYYKTIVPISQYNISPQHPFGIPIIEKSNNQTYQFEVKLLENTKNTPGLALSNKFPVLISHYVFPKNVLLKNNELLSEFMLKKILYHSNDDSFWKVLIVYNVPLILYLIYLLFKRKIRSFDIFKQVIRKLSFVLNPYLLFVFLCIGIDIFVVKKYTDTTTSILTFLWIIGIFAYRLESRYSFGFALIFLIFCPFLLSADMTWVPEKSATWAYMFLVVGTIQAVFELKASESPKIKAFINKISSKLVFITHIDSFLKTYIKKMEDFGLYSLRNFIKIFIIFIITSTLFFIGFDLYVKVMSYRDRQLKNPSTPHIEPTLVYPGTKVILYGDRFGDGISGQYALMRNGIKIRTDYWEDHKIIFTVPLDWKKPEEIKIWIEKPISWKEKTIIEKTKPITIKILLVTDHFTPDDDLYFEQLKTWKKETKEVNGYK